MPLHDPHGRPPARLAMAAAGVALFLVAYYWGNQYKHKLGDQIFPNVEGVLIRPTYPLPGFELRDAGGQPFTAEQLARHWTLLAFTDPSQAPGRRAIRRMIEVRNRLASNLGLQEMLQIILVSETQDPALARDFAHLSQAVKLLSGESEEIHGLRAAVGAPPSGSTAGADDEIPFYLIGPTGRLSALFADDQVASSISSDLIAIAKHSDTFYSPDD